MDALVAALGCSLMMVVALGGFAWYAVRRRHSAPSSEVAALRAERAELRLSEPAPPRGEPGKG